MRKITANSELQIGADRIRKEFDRIRHLGYYNSFGRILFDNAKVGLNPMEGEEEKHILNGTVASTLRLWTGSDHILGPTLAFVMVRREITALIIPLRQRSGSYLLAIFEKNTPVSYVERVRNRIAKLIRN